jgi:hypothetical protein
MSASCPECGYPISMKDKGSNDKAGCGCLLIGISLIFDLFLFPIGFLIGIPIFLLGLWLMHNSSKKQIPYCSNCGWQGK